MTDLSSASDANYVERYVAFLDILGFSELTQRADEHPDWHQYLHSIITELNSTLPKHVDCSGFRFAQFSDCIVLSAIREPDGLWAVISGCKMLVTNMLMRGILLRGGLAAGRFFHDDQIMFGPALVRAHAFDTPGAPPHIGIDPAIPADMINSDYSVRFLEFISYDPWDLTPILHTLHEYEHYTAAPVSGGVPLESPADFIANMLTQYASDMNKAAAVRSKWRWMQDYWNRTIAARAILAPSPPLPRLPTVVS